MFKRSLLGYRRADVEAAIALRDGALADAGSRLVAARELIDGRDEIIGGQRAQLDAAAVRIADLESIAGRLSERVVERERELKLMRAELSELNASSDQGMKALVAVADELDALRGQARGQATRIRMQALSEAAELSDKLSAIAQRPVEVRERLVAALSDVLSESFAASPASLGEEEALAELPGPESVAAGSEEAGDDLGLPANDGESESAETLDPISELAAEVEAAVGADDPIVISAFGREPAGGSDVAEATEDEHDAPALAPANQINGGATRELVHPADLFRGMVEVEIGPLDDFRSSSDSRMPPAASRERPRSRSSALPRAGRRSRSGSRRRSSCCANSRAGHRSSSACETRARIA